MPTGTADAPERLVLLGGSTPLGAEIRARLAEAPVTFGDAILAEVDPTDEDGGRLVSEFAGEALMVIPVDDIQFAPGDLTILCGDPAGTGPVLERAAASGTCIDVSGAARGRPDVPWAHRSVSGDPPGRGLIAAPQPVSATMVELLAPLVTDELLRATSATVLLPASALGEPATEELYQQTIGLLNFTELPRERLAHQLAFNVLPWEDPARPGSGSLSEDLTGEIRRLLPDAPGCDLQLLLAPTFHGYGYSIRLQTDGRVSEDDLANRFEAAGLHVSRGGGAPASPVEALQQNEQTLISRLHRVAPDVVWVWAVADSLGAGAADNVVRLVRRLMGR